MKKFCGSFRKYKMEIINYKNEFIHKQTAEIIWKWKKLKKNYISKEKFEDKHVHCKFTEHCHYTGNYRGAAHRICN